MTTETTIIVRGPRRYFHGGVPGLTPGAWILPPDQTGTALTTSRFLDTEDDFRPWLRQRDCVYVTPDPEIAWTFAGAYPNGALYVVVPAHPLTLDPDSPVEGLSWQCPRAQVTEVLDPEVTLAELLEETPIIAMTPLIAFKVGHAVGKTAGRAPAAQAGPKRPR